MTSPSKNLVVYLYQWLVDFLYGPTRLVSFFKPGPLRERLGFYDPEALRPLASGDNVWLHAASAGEVNALMPLVRALKAARPKAKLILTTSSQTGKKLALEKQAADAVFLAPLDMGRPLRRAFQAFRPSLLLIAETEIWPQWLLRAAQNQVPLLMVNGRVSDKSYPTYRRLRALFAPALCCFNQCLVQTAGDRDKLIALGLPEKRVQVMGQMKYDLKAPGDAAAKAFGEAVGFSGGETLAVLGSLREGELEAWLPELPGLLGRHPKLQLILAPRHIKNAPHYQTLLSEAGIPSRLRSRPAEGPARVLVLDTVGELSLAYHLARVAFVGGTLVPVGGHNVMEPALSGVPVLFGPQTANVAEAVEALLRAGGGFQADNARALAGILESLLDPAASHVAGEKARRAVESLRGATDKNLKAVLDYLPDGL
ncbi:MAG TPA: glycosyltransferase N-terminal domain-containing protein [bacterium]|nr:glycosyltransferase N-terminal domain-containing protein [bacterium]